MGWGKLLKFASVKGPDDSVGRSLKLRASRLNGGSPGNSGGRRLGRRGKKLLHYWKGVLSDALFLTAKNLANSN